MAAVVVFLNVLGWVLLTRAVGHHFHISQAKLFGLGTGVLAYTLGMRHAFDADHIAAIDNTTRKLVGEGKRPLGAGFFFSLGHSSVVVLLAVASSFGIKALNVQVSQHASGLHSVTNIVGTSILGHVPLPDRPGEPVRAALDHPDVPQRCEPAATTRPSSSASSTSGGS